jgi:diguanylate cyclase (GGDEF)-like protein/PAS domain S-box-containing protein
MPVGVSWATLADQKIVYMNRHFTEVFGYVVGDFECISDWIGKYPVLSDRDMANARWGKYFENPDGVDFPIEPMELSIPCKDGSVKTFLHSGIILPKAGWALATFIDITKRKSDELLLRQAERRAVENQSIYQTLLEHSQEMIVLASFDGQHRHVSPRVLQITGWTPEEYLERPLSEVFHPEDLPSVMHALDNVKAGGEPGIIRNRIIHKDGSVRWIEALIRSYVDSDSNQPIGYVATVRDISHQVEQEELAASERRQLSEYASQDELTGIPNRRQFNQSLELEVRRRTRKTLAIALLMLDVDYFKQYNDIYGHLPGDACLKQIAAAFQRTTNRSSDLTARFGGEEFVILLPMTDREGAEHIARVALEGVRALAIPHSSSPSGIVTVSIGVACWPAGKALDPLSFVQRADDALYRAKRAGRNGYSILECNTIEPL